MKVGDQSRGDVINIVVAKEGREVGIDGAIVVCVGLFTRASLYLLLKTATNHFSDSFELLAYNR